MRNDAVAWRNLSATNVGDNDGTVRSDAQLSAVGITDPYPFLESECGGPSLCTLRPAAPRPSAITSGQAGSLTRPGTHAALSGGSPTSASTAERESRYPILSFGLSAERIALKVRVPRLASRSNE